MNDRKSIQLFYLTVRPTVFEMFLIRTFNCFVLNMPYYALSQSLDVVFELY